MSEILSLSTIKPNDFPWASLEHNPQWDLVSDLISIPSVLRIPLANEDITSVPDLRALRSLSRAGLILFHVAKNCTDGFKGWLSVDSSRIGLYCGVDQGPLDYRLVKDTATAAETEMGQVMLRSMMPKQIFKMYPNYSTNQVGIMLGVQGPMLTFTNMKYASLHALEQAEVDLWSGDIDLALVCSANSVEDPLVGLRILGHSRPGITLTEGGAALLLKKSKTRKDWFKKIDTADQLFYGISDPLIRIACEEKTEESSNG